MNIKKDVVVDKPPVKGAVTAATPTVEKAVPEVAKEKPAEVTKPVKVNGEKKPPASALLDVAAKVDISSALSKQAEQVEAPEPASTVIIEGRRMAPVIVGHTSYDQCNYAVDGVEVQVPYEFRYSRQFRPIQPVDDDFGPNSNFVAPPVDVYVLQFENTKVVLFMDRNSTFIVEDRQQLKSFRRNVATNAVLLLNSHVRNTEFIGQSALVNVDVSESLINNSSVTAVNERQGKRRPWDGPSDNNHIKVGDVRHRFFGVRLKQCTVLDSALAEGDYRGSHIMRSEVKGGSKKVVIIRSNIRGSEIEGTSVYIKGLSLNRSVIRSEGELLITGYTGSLDEANWNFNGIHLRNRFGYAKIDVISQRGGSVELMRSSDKEVELRFGYTSEKFNLLTEKHRIDQVLRKLLGYEETAFPIGGFGFGGQYAPPTESVEASIVRYVGDTVRSRIGMIEMLDQVLRNAKLITNERDAYDDMYSPTN